jgi:hypothetical protein
MLGVGPGDAVVFEATAEGIRVARDTEPGAFAAWSGRFRKGRGKTAAEIDRELKALRGRLD